MNRRTGIARSADGTRISYERVGTGPVLVLVDAAAHFRDFSSFDGLTERLTTDFTVVRFDRRGRGESTDEREYSVEREVGDLAAVIDAVGGTAFVHAFSSGGLLAVQAAAAGLPIRAMTLLEPPIENDERGARDEQRAFTTGLIDLVDAGRPSDAVEYYLTGIGVPDELIDPMRSTPAWVAMVSVAPTLVYDCRLSQATSLDLLRSVRVRTLVLASACSTDDLRSMAAAVAAGLPEGTYRSLPGSWHGVADDALAPALRAFFLG